MTGTIIPRTRNKNIQNPEIKSGVPQIQRFKSLGDAEGSIFSAGLTAWVDQDTEVNLFYLEQNDGH